MSDSKEQSKAKDIQEDVKDSAHQIWLAGLGALAAVEEGGTKLFKDLVEKGKGYESRGRQAVDEAKDRVEEAAGKARASAESGWGKVEEKLDDAVSGALHRLGVPTREEIQTLTKRVEELTKVVEQVKSKRAAAAK